MSEPVLGPLPSAQPLGVTAARGVFWTGAGQIARQVIQIVTSVVLARLLVPEDFGLVGMAMVFLAVAQLFVDFGVGAAIVHARTSDRTVLSSCFWANACVAGAFAVLVALISPLAGTWYRDPRIPSVLAALCLSLAFSGLTVVPGSILYRDMSFAKLAKAQVLASIAGAGVAVGAAWLGGGVWSLVAQPVVGGLVTLVLMVTYSRWWPALTFSWQSIRDLIHFSANLLGSNLLTYATRNTDSFLIGRYVGPVGLGYYSLAYQIMLYPLSQVSSVIVRVLFPTLSQLRGQEERFRNAYLKSISAIALVTFPIMMGLFAVAQDFVTVVFGEKWLPMLPVLKILCWVGMLQSIGTTVGTIYLATGRMHVAFKFLLVAAPVLVLAFIVGLSWGIVGVATAYAAASFGLFYVSLTIAFRIACIRLRDFHAAIARPLLASVVMLVVVTVSTSILQQWGIWERLGTEIGIGVLAYAGATLLLNKRQLRELLAITRAALSKSVPTQA